MDNCYLCNSLLDTDNSSKEHIILNSIGGRLKSRKLLCKSCNSKLGHIADNELSKQLQFLSSYFQVKREKGRNQIIKGGITESGEEYHLVDGSKPILSKPKIEKKTENGETKYQLVGRNEKELIGILKGISKNHPEFNLEEARKKFEWKEEYLNEYLSHNMTIGGKLSNRSIAKSAVNYYIHTQKECEQVRHLFGYLVGEEELQVVQHYYPKKPAYRKQINEVLHLIHLYGNRQKKLLYCFIEFFSTYSFFVLLSNNYSGNSISEVYCYDVIKSEEIEKKVHLKLEKFRTPEIRKMNVDDFGIITKKLNRVLVIGNKIQTEREIGNITRKAIDKVFDKYKSEPVLTQIMIDEVVNEISTTFAKFANRGKKL